MFRCKPMCEMCGKNEATHFTLERPDTVNHNEIKSNGKWRFVCVDENNYNEFSHIAIKDFFKDPMETVDLMAHYHQKDWMNWKEFMDMMVRFRKAVNGWN